MISWLTELPYGWYILLLTALAWAQWVARQYMDRPLTPADEYCAGVDQDVARQEALVEARLEAIDQRALLEDDEVAQLDALWELPVYRKRETA